MKEMICFMRAFRRATLPIVIFSTILLANVGMEASARGIPAIEESWEPHSIIVSDLNPTSGFEWDSDLKRILADDAMVSQPSLMVDTDSTLWLCWESNYMVYVASRGEHDSHWLIQCLIANESQLLGEPHMCQGPEDNYWLVYSAVEISDISLNRSSRGTGIDGDDEHSVPEKAIYLISSTDGIQWSDPVAIAARPNVENANPWIAWDSEHLWVLWDSNLDSERRNIWMSWSPDGSNWCTPSAILADDNYDRDPTLTFVDSIAYIAWTSDEFDIYGHAGDQAEDLVVYSKSTDWLTWSQPIPIHQRY